MKLFEGLFDGSVATAETLLDGECPPLLPEEAVAVRGAVAGRQREFAFGRFCARVAMSRMGRLGFAVPMGSDRAPIWPAGLVGSITHSKTYCAAAVAAMSDGVRSIGIDLEEATPLERDLEAEICTASERRWLAAKPDVERGLHLKAIFCAKESAYKCQYPVTRQLIGFDAIGIELDVENGTFAATFERDVLPYHAGERLSGRIRFAAGHIATAVVV